MVKQNFGGTNKECYGILIVANSREHSLRSNGQSFAQGLRRRLWVCLHGGREIPVPGRSFEDGPS